MVSRAGPDCKGVLARTRRDGEPDHRAHGRRGRQRRTGGGSLMSVLPDYLVHGLSVVFCGTAVGMRSAARGHYYAGKGNEFWQNLFQAGLTPHQLMPADDASITSHGID